MATTLANRPLMTGDIVRYSEGLSALFKLHSPHAGGWHGEHVLGGSHFASDQIFNKLKLADKYDLDFCKERRPEWFEIKSMGIFELHEKFTKSLFPAYSSEDERFLALALCGEAGELANIIKKRWRDGVDLSEEACDEIADIRVYLELIAKCFNIEGSKLDERVKQKLLKVVEKHKARL